MVGVLISIYPSQMFTNPIPFHCIGVKVTIEEGKEVICKARLLFALADLPAKASLYNIMQFNGRYGCPTCKHEGEQVCSCIMVIKLELCLHCRCQSEEEGLECIGLFLQ